MTTCHVPREVMREIESRVRGQVVIHTDGVPTIASGASVAPTVRMLSTGADDLATSIMAHDRIVQKYGAGHDQANESARALAYCIIAATR